MSEELALMVVRTGEFDLGVDAGRVQEVMPVARWGGGPAIELASLVGADAGDGAARILLVTRAGREPVAALVMGAVTLRQVLRTQLLALPAPLAAHVRWVSHVVVTDGQPPLLVLDTERL